MSALAALRPVDEPLAQTTAQTGAPAIAAAPGAVSAPAANTAVSALYSRLRGAVWKHGGEDAPLEACGCALILALEPTISVANIAEALPTGTSALSLPDLLNAMINIGYKSKQTAAAPNEIDRRLLPCLFLPKEGAAPGEESAYVIRSVQDTPAGPVFTVFDGNDGSTREWTADHPRARAVGLAVFFRSAKRDEEPTSPAAREQTGRSWFGAVMSRFKGGFMQLSAIGFALSLVGLGTPMFIMLVYDRVIAPRTTEPLPYLVAGVALAIGLEWKLRGLRSRQLSWLTARLDFIVGTTIFERLVQLPPAYIERAPIAAQIARIKTFESVRDFFSGPIFMSVLELPTILVSLTVIAVFGGMLALVPLGVALAYIVLFFVMQRLVMVSIRQAAVATSATQQFSLETFEKLEAIRGSGLSKAWLEKYNDLSGRENLAQFKLFFLGSVGETLAHALTVVAAVMTLAFGVGLIWDGAVSAGALVASMILTWRVLTPFHSLCMMVPRFEQMRNAIQQINDLMNVPTESEADDVSARLTELKGRVSFVNASLRYSREAGPVFLGLNADIKPGEIIVVSGANGAGKSSILKMIQGLYSPLTGSLRLDGFEIRQLVQRDLRRMIGYVPQSPDFLAGTIADNLRFAKPLAAEDELWKALEEVGAADLVRALPNGLETEVKGGDEALLGSSLRYRLAFARAMLHGGALLLIDEQPNAVLNAGCADLLKEIISKSRGKRTVIFVSHRVDLMRFADRVLRLRRGQTPVCAPLDQVLEQAT